MITILHGENTFASYSRLQEILRKFQDHKKFRFSDKNSQEELLLSLGTFDLIEDKRIFIIENFISQQKIESQKLKDISNDQILIFWEKSKLTKSAANKISPYVNIEEFKLAPKLFHFLDSLTVKNKRVFKYLYSLSSQEESSLIWHITNRIFQLLLVKLNMSISESSKISSKSIQPWQWQKIKSQSIGFDLKTLQNLFTGVLKVDYIMKRGKTDLPLKTLLTMLFVKYL